MLDLRESRGARESGVAAMLQIIVERPSLSGLDVENNIKRIVDYLEARDYPREEIATYLKKTL